MDYHDNDDEDNQTLFTDLTGISNSSFVSPGNLAPGVDAALLNGGWGFAPNGNYGIPYMWNGVRSANVSPEERYNENVDNIDPRILGGNLNHNEPSVVDQLIADMRAIEEEAHYRQFASQLEEATRLALQGQDDVLLGDPQRRRVSGYFTEPKRQILEHFKNSLNERVDVNTITQVLKFVHHLCGALQSIARPIEEYHRTGRTIVHDRQHLVKMLLIIELVIPRIRNIKELLATEVDDDMGGILVE